MTPATGRLIDEIRALVGDRCSTSESVRDHHSHGESWHAPARPDAVAFPESTVEVSAIVQACARARVSIVPFGMGSSLEGHVNAIHGGVSIDLTRMTASSGFRRKTSTVTAEARQAIQQTLSVETSEREMFLGPWRFT